MGGEFQNVGNLFILSMPDTRSNEIVLLGMWASDLNDDFFLAFDALLFESFHEGAVDFGVHGRKDAGGGNDSVEDLLCCDSTRHTDEFGHTAVPFRITILQQRRRDRFLHISK